MFAKKRVVFLVLSLLLLAALSTIIQSQEPTSPKPFLFTFGVQQVQEKAGEYKVTIVVKDAKTDEQLWLLALDNWRGKKQRLMGSDLAQKYNFVVNFKFAQNPTEVSYEFSAKLKGKLLQEEKGTTSIKQGKVA